jgi:8-hydroxy-5-deazaflavin:NADPH oxidoreductase
LGLDRLNPHRLNPGRPGRGRPAAGQQTAHPIRNPHGQQAINEANVDARTGDPGRPTGSWRASLPNVQIGVMGATGPAGRAVSVQLAAVGIDVIVGSRSEERAADTVATLHHKWPGRDLPLHPGSNDAASGADLVIVATPWEGVLTTATSCEQRLAGKIVISMANALTRWGKDMVPLLPPTGSVTLAVARTLPRSRVVGAFHHLPAEAWGDLDRPLDADVMVCSDEPAATAEVMALIERLPGLRGVDCGAISSALAIEALTAVLLEVNRRYHTHTAVRFTGLPDRRRD